MVFTTTAGRGDSELGRPEKNWVQCLADGLKVMRATERVTGKPSFRIWSRYGDKGEGGQETWEVIPGAHRSGGLCDGEMTQGRNRRGAGYATQSGTQRVATTEREGSGGGERGRTETAVEVCRNEMVSCGKVLVR